MSQAPAAEAAQCSSAGLNIVAHEDDDLLFLSPDIAHDVAAGGCVRTVYVTAGDDGSNDGWRGREDGVKAAYASMAGVSNVWSSFSLTLSGQTLTAVSLTSRPNISLVFLRLPDGYLDGSGFAIRNFESLEKLDRGVISQVHAIDGSAVYTRQSLTTLLAAIMSDFAAPLIRTQDFVIAYDNGDHSDHVAVARLALDAHRQYSVSHTLVGYADYRIADLPMNVQGQDYANKRDAFLTYAQYDPAVCNTASACLMGDYGAWWSRQYVSGTEIGGTTPPPTTTTTAPTTTTTTTPSTTTTTTAPGSSVNVASSATVTASSESVATQQLAIKSVDGVVDGYPGDYTREWATVNGRTGSWLRLVWPSARVLDHVVLHDRPNTSDRITGATLQFSDGTSVAVGSLPNNGTGLTVSFAPRSTTSLLLTVTAVSSATQNVGLSEIETYATA